MLGPRAALTCAMPCCICSEVPREISMNCFKSGGVNCELWYLYLRDPILNATLISRRPYLYYSPWLDTHHLLPLRRNNHHRTDRPRHSRAVLPSDGRSSEAWLAEYCFLIWKIREFAWMKGGVVKERVSFMFEGSQSNKGISPRFSWCGVKSNSHSKSTSRGHDSPR